jgi:hypothetical protein
MLEIPAFLTRLKVRVAAMLPEHWRGSAGQRLQETINTLSEYSEKNIRIKDKLEEAPNVLWETLKERSSRALVNAAEEELRRIDIELARQTLADKARQEKANADRLETEARVSRVNEMEARLCFVEKLRRLSTVPVWDHRGRMMFVKAPANFNWDELTQRLITADDLILGEIEATQPPDVIGG